MHAYKKYERIELTTQPCSLVRLLHKECTLTSSAPGGARRRRAVQPSVASALLLVARLEESCGGAAARLGDAMAKGRHSASKRAPEYGSAAAAERWRPPQAAASWSWEGRLPPLRARGRRVVARATARRHRAPGLGPQPALMPSVRWGASIRQRAAATTASWVGAGRATAGREAVRQGECKPGGRPRSVRRHQGEAAQEWVDEGV